MGHIFISYSHKDKKYVEKLEKKLIEEGFDVWIDHSIDYGSQWTEAIEKAIDTCDAYIAVMSDDAKRSPWVQREVIYAEKRKKPFFPLLLKGEAWFSLGNIQYVDVTDGSLPEEKFYKRLEKVTLRKIVETDLQPLLPDSTRKKNLKLPKLPIDPKIGLRMFGIVAMLAVVAFGMPKLINLMGQIQFPTRVPTSTYTRPPTITKTPKILTSTLTVTPTVTISRTTTRTPTKLPTKTPTLSPTSTNTPTNTYTMQPDPLVSAYISANPTSGKVPLTVSFDINLYWSDGDNACKDIACTYYWKIQDDNGEELVSGNSKSFFHTFQVARPYSVQAGACSGGNCASTSVGILALHK